MVYDKTFLLTGGRTGDNLGDYLTDIYQYNAEVDDWIKLTTELKTTRNSHVSLLVPKSLFPECTKNV